MSPTIIHDATVRDERYKTAENAYRAAVTELVDATLAVIPDIVRSFYPDACDLVVEGEWGEEFLNHVTVAKLLDAAGEELPTDGAWDDLCDALGEHLGWLAELPGDEYLGEHTIEFPT